MSKRRFASRKFATWKFASRRFAGEFVSLYVPVLHYHTLIGPDKTIRILQGPSKQVHVLTGSK